jgi:DNA-binding transcriptional ArsR family regulator
MTPLDFALDYAAHGWAVLPLHSYTGGSCTCRKACGSPAKHPRTEHGLADATTDPETIRAWWSSWPDANLGLAIPEGYVAVDVDHESAYRALHERGWELPVTAIAETGRGRHHLYRTDVHMRPQVGLLEHVDLRGPGSYIVAPPSVHSSGKKYTWLTKLSEAVAAPDWLVAEAQNGRHPLVNDQAERISEGARNATLTSLAGTMRRRGMTAAALEAALLAENRARCAPPLPDEEVRVIAASVGRYEPGERSVREISEVSEISRRSVSEVSELSEVSRSLGVLTSQTSLNSQRDWPQPPGAAAFHGLPGRVVEVVDPYTEADPVAVLATFLAAFGSLVGSGPHALVGADRHGAKLFLALVGKSAKARKGASWTPVRELFRQVDPDWTLQRVIGGLGSGEGLVYAVRDRVERTERRKDGEFDLVVTDPGEEDKRALVLAPELAALLRVMARQGSTVSAVLRDAWDRGDLRITTRNSPIRATGAHVSVIAHVTEEELRRELTDTETVNGFGNRFLWLVVRRSKELPEPEPFRGHVIDALAAEIRESALATASMDGEVARTAAARELWREAYPDLSAERSGLAGALTDRGEPQVLRLSLLYALADGSSVIDVPHLEAGLELWRYVERSAIYLFGDATGDPVADRILAVLRQAPQDRAGLHDLFGRHMSARRLEHALAALTERGLVVTEPERTGGRPREIWRLKDPKGDGR